MSQSNNLNTNTLTPYEPGWKLLEELSLMFTSKTSSTHNRSSLNR